MALPWAVNLAREPPSHMAVSHGSGPTEACLMGVVHGIGKPGFSEPEFCHQVP
jgi:hypothetical protein